MRSLLVVVAVASIGPSLTLADGPADNRPEAVRRIPKLGIDIAPADREALEKGLTALAESISKLEAKKDAKVDALLPDVQVYHKAVRDALTHQEFFDPKEVGKAKVLLIEGARRAEQLMAGASPWTRQTGLVVRGYVSRIDGSVQPYGLVVPESYVTPGAYRHRLDVWFHGRGETLSEVNFITEREHRVGEFSPPDTIVLHPYGRYCNANRFAGEVDVLEALEAVKGQYRVDDDRIAVRGFSMGGASCWQFATHYADRWFAANPGAGFSETAKFLNVFQGEKVTPTWYQQKLWHLYDSTDYAANLLQCPTVAYSGEIDRQKQAADLMEEALRAEDVRLVHIIGPQTAHKYHPDAHREVDRRLASIAEAGRKHIFRSVDFVTYTLKYHKMNWVTIDGLEEHWVKAIVRAQIVGESSVNVTTVNVSAVTLDMPPGWCPLEPTASPVVTIDGTAVAVPRVRSDRSWHVELVKEAGVWDVLRAVARPGSPAPNPPEPNPGLRKVHGLQGPIDDAFMDAFLVVRPTGTARSARVGAWALAEEGARAIEHWRRHFRGDARVKDDIMTSPTPTSPRLEPHPLGRPVGATPSSSPDRRQAADPLGWGQGRRGRPVLPGRRPCPGADLSQPAQPEQVCRSQQRIHLSRV